MPREDKVFKKRSDREAYGDGKKESKKSGLWEDTKQGLKEESSKLFWDTRGPNQKAYDEGWKDGEKLRKEYRNNQRKGSRSSTGNGGSTLSFFVGVIVIVVLGYLSIYHPSGPLWYTEKETIKRNYAEGRKVRRCEESSDCSVTYEQEGKRIIVTLNWSNTKEPEKYAFPCNSCFK